MLLTFSLFYQHFSRKVCQMLAQLDYTAKFAVNN